MRNNPNPVLAKVIATKISQINELESFTDACAQYGKHPKVVLEGYMKHFSRSVEALIDGEQPAERFLWPVD